VSTFHVDIDENNASFIYIEAGLTKGVLSTCISTKIMTFI